MALKDWHQYNFWTDYYPSEDWERIDDKYSSVRVWKTGLPLYEMKRRGESGVFLVGINDRRKDKKLKKSFKTKSQALAYAKSYMRKY
jgi:hypothetical protein